jgi:hypothetical protein
MLFGSSAEAPVLVRRIRVALCTLAEPADMALLRRPWSPADAIVEAVLDLLGRGGVFMFLVSHVHGMRAARIDRPRRVSRLTMPAPVLKGRVPPGAFDDCDRIPRRLTGLSTAQPP